MTPAMQKTALATALAVLVAIVVAPRFGLTLGQ
jgi:hypothetical protein